jgi:hypothetical protein
MRDWIPTGEAFVDNSGALFKATQGKADKKGMYMRKRVKFLQEAERWGEAAITKIRTDDNRADILTKMLSTKLLLQEDEGQDPECESGGGEHPRHRSPPAW